MKLDKACFFSPSGLEKAEEIQPGGNLLRLPFHRPQLGAQVGQQRFVRRFLQADEAKLGPQPVGGGEMLAVQPEGSQLGVVFVHPPQKVRFCGTP